MTDSLRPEADWPKERVIAATMEHKRLYPDAPWRTRPHAIWRALQTVEHARRDYEAGDPLALLGAVTICGEYGLLIPEWAAEALSSAFYRVEQFEAKSWDEAFGAPHPKGKHLDRARKSREKGPAIYARIMDIVHDENPTPPIDDALFERVGKEFGLSRSKANNLFYGEIQRYQDLKRRYSD